MRFLVTGGAGFVGSHLCDALLQKHEVVSVDSAGPHPNPLVTSFTGTVSDFCHDVNLWRLIPNLMHLIDRPTPGFDIIFHTAATPRVGVSLERPAEVLRNNIDSTVDMLEYCRRHPFTKLVFISSSSVTFTDTKENPYALSKKMGEELVQLYVNTFGVKATTVRLFNVYGPGEASYGQYTTLVRRCKQSILTGVDFELHGDGSQVRDFTHITDVTEGLMMIMNLLVEDRHLPLYELGSADAKYSVKDVISAFARGTSLGIKKRPARPGDPHLTMADPRLRPPGWEPKRDIIEYIAQWKRTCAAIETGCESAVNTKLDL